MGLTNSSRLQPQADYEAASSDATNLHNTTARADASGSALKLNGHKWVRLYATLQMIPLTCSGYPARATRATISTSSSPSPTPTTLLTGGTRSSSSTRLSQE